MLVRRALIPISVLAPVSLAFLLCVRAASPARPVIRFADSSATSGLDFILNNSPTPQKYLPET
ncbi:MAG: hypothetical protein ACREH9_10290, partial [Pseudomonadota bacterium]